MPQRSAGIMLFRRPVSRGLEVLLVHPGGPFWRNKDDGAWSIPKGLYDQDEEPLAAAKREFLEETGCAVDGAFIDLGTFKQASGKIIAAFALEGDFDLASFKCNTFAIEWPPKSGRMQDFPEADRADWFAPDVALRKIAKGQVPILKALLAKLGVPA
jgi:predicted NUDIX family NTP pyrophosphohydrolase